MATRQPDGGTYDRLFKTAVAIWPKIFKGAARDRDATLLLQKYIETVDVEVPLEIVRRDDGLTNGVAAL